MQVHLHQTQINISDFQAVQEYLKTEIGQSDAPGLHLFPELFLCGYPLQDLVLQRPFIAAYEKHLQGINNWAKSWQSTAQALLLGGLDYKLDEAGLPLKIENCIFLLEPGKSLKKVYTKKLLPNYDIFDEKRYFSPGQEDHVFSWGDKTFGLLICEDMWASSVHNTDPCRELQQEVEKKKCSLDAIINLSASPFNLGKFATRVERAKEISKVFSCPFFYVNKVGLEDEILFDGQSFVVNGGNLLGQGKSFEADDMSLLLPEKTGEKEDWKSETKNTFEDLFSPTLDFEARPVTLRKWQEHDFGQLFNALGFAYQEYAKKTGFKHFTIALSGGMDSALVLTIMKLFLERGQTLEAVYMPSQYSSSLSYDLSHKLCQNLSVKLNVFPIKFLHAAARNAHKDNFGQELSGLADENIQSRMRGMILYARSNQLNSLVINTSNKSELAVGYSTLYGDSVGALSLLGDLYKSEVFELARYINRHHNNIIPEGIITRPPSAELRENQEDAQSLPPYEILDAILEGILSFRMGEEELLDLGFEEEYITQALNLYRKTEYKRYQFCPIVKLKAKSFGFGYRIPITKNSNFYTT